MFRGYRRIATTLIAAGVAWAGVGGTLAQRGVAATPSCTDSWTHVGDGSWSAAANWSAGHVPTSADDVCVTTDATYTITLQGSQTVRSLYLAGAHGNKTLELQATESTGDAHLTMLSASHFASRDVVMLSSAGATANRAWLDQQGGALLNESTINVEGNGVVPTQYLWGSIDNRHVINVDTNTQTDASAAVLTAGQLNIADGVELEVRHSVTNNLSIAAAGSGVMYEDGGTYNQNFGTTSGVMPVVVDNSAITYTAGSVAAIVARGSGSLVGGGGSMDTIVLQATDAEGVSSRSGGWANSGPFVLTSAGTTANAAQVDGNFDNRTGGDLDVKTNGVVAAQSITGTVTNEIVGRIELEAGATLDAGALIERPNSTLQTDIGDASHFGVVESSNPATLAGALVVQTSASFVPSVGQSYAIITAPSFTGAFHAYRNLVLDASGLYYQPRLTATALDLVVTRAVMTVVPGHAPAGASVVVKGHGWMPNEDVNISLRDHGTAKLATVIADATGSFNEAVAIPSGSVSGPSKIAANQPFTHVGVTRSFTVD